jgi:hypothetical protein
MFLPLEVATGCFVSQELPAKVEWRTHSSIHSKGRNQSHKADLKMLGAVDKKVIFV